MTPEPRWIQGEVAGGYDWAGVELNHRHTDFQSVALPTELPALLFFVSRLNLAKEVDIARKLDLKPCINLTLMGEMPCRDVRACCNGTIGADLGCGLPP